MLSLKFTPKVPSCLLDWNPPAFYMHFCSCGQEVRCHSLLCYSGTGLEPYGTCLYIKASTLYFAQRLTPDPRPAQVPPIRYRSPYSHRLS
jgi:hypothetical protein